MAENYEMNKDIVSLFALFHDCQRIDDCIDELHGARGAELARQFRGRFYELNDEDFSILYEACRKHTVEHFIDDFRIGLCFDADRLDLVRIGVEPDPQLLNTPEAKKLASYY